MNKHAKSDDIADLVKTRIESIRPKLLDLTRRNPLIATKLTPRSNSHIRVVDELPDVLFSRLANGQKMRFVPLPELNEDPQDENAPGFRDALIAARHTDDEYKAESEKLDANSPDFPNRSRIIERELKDRIREFLKMPTREAGREANVAQHARNHGITPSYDLPALEEEHEDGRHTDDNIQTLQLPRDLERKLNAMFGKGKTWEQETGINVLHAAFGFLEWTEPKSRDSNLSPLIVMPVVVERRRTRDGLEFWVSGTGEDSESNGVLAEKFRRDFGIELPPYLGGSAEEYLTEIGSQTPKTMTWRVRRQVVFGVFPSARMAMYRDLDPEETNFDDNDIIRALLAGKETTSLAPYAEDYETDSQENELKVPLIVRDADSSQVSTLIDVADGKNVSVEGPPGTGKSQTIVNAIAAALAVGKKVLFVAEKTAALDVVKSRLEAVGLGEFILALQAGSSTREQVMDSIRKRIDIRQGRSPRDFELSVDSLRKTRAEMAEYIALMTKKFDDTNFTVHEIIGKGISTANQIERLPSEVRTAENVPERRYSAEIVREIVEKGFSLDKALLEVRNADNYWSGTQITHLAPFQADKILMIAGKLAVELRELSTTRKNLVDCELRTDLEVGSVRELLALLEGISASIGFPSVEKHSLLLGRENTEKTAQFFNGCEECQLIGQQLSDVLIEPESNDLSDRIQTAYQICKAANIDSLDIKAVREGLSLRQQKLNLASEIPDRVQEFSYHVQEAALWPFRDLDRAHNLVNRFGRKIIALRHSSLAEASAIEMLKNLLLRASVLFERRKAISEKLSVTGARSLEELHNDIASLKGAGALSFLSSAVSAAKKHYLSISKRQGFDRASAIADLQELADFTLETSRFAENAQSSTLFGIHFQGAETDFEKFDKLAEFYDEIDLLFPQPKQRPIRDFLKTGDTALVLALPDVSAFPNERDLGGVRTAIASLNQNCETVMNALDELEGIVHLFRDAKKIAPSELPKLADTCRDFNQKREQLDTNKDMSDLLGEAFNGWRTKVTPMEPVLSLAAAVQKMNNIAQSVAQLAQSNRLEELFTVLQKISSSEDDVEKLVQRLSNEGQISLTPILANSTSNEAGAFFEGAAQDRDGLMANSRLAQALADIEQTGFLWSVDSILEANPEALGFGDFLEALISRYLTRKVYDLDGELLTKYSGQTLDAIRSKISSLDKKIILLSQEKIRAELVGIAKPPIGIGVGRKADYTQMSLIWSEIQKKKRHISVRDLTSRAGDALQEIKPCWMMSPLSVAQFIPKQTIQFDLCIIDEASQMPPEDAIGALYRSHQTMIVGDTNQLPPSNFFKKMLDDDGDDDEQEAVLEESILEMANSTFRPTRRLRWHYRSRHSALISFSNRLIYNDDLVIFPSPEESRPEMGVSLQLVSGRYKSGLNVDEARTVVEAARDFMKTHPDRSLGIVTLNKAQSEHISELFYNDVMLKNPHMSRYVENWDEKNDGLERFFIKNLENVQGDERDVIYISTVYGPETIGGTVMQRFGPINGLAGRRRLNVLFSRAKEQIVTYSSMTAADVTADEHGNSGANMLKRWLEYSATGRLESGLNTQREPDSDFERHVIAQIQAIGCEAVPQVGVAGYFIDIGVKHPEWPHGYILGVECDGAAYHSARSARDRDRLRQQVLEGLGWNLHRIWSTDWFNNPRKEAEVLRRVVSERIKALKERETVRSKMAPAAPSSVDLKFNELPTAKEVPATKDIQASLNLLSPKESPVVAAVKLVPGNNAEVIEIGDTVRLRYLTHDKNTIQITITPEKNDPSKGKINHLSPLAEAILGAEEDEEVEVLNGSYLRRAIVEKIVEKGTIFKKPT
jgi:very-short-patch-repair endonuclease